ADSTIADFTEQAQACWQEEWLAKDSASRALMDPALADLRISATTLNDFLAYDSDDLEGTHSKGVFLGDKLFGFPGAPTTALDFGSILHGFLEKELKNVLQGEPGETVSEDELIRFTENEIANLDYASDELDQLKQRFKAFYQVYLPHWKTIVQADPTQYVAEQWVSARLDDTIPLTGKCDLLFLDKLQKKVTIFDYKSGNRKTPEKVREERGGIGYQRQLEFYQLLIENTVEPGLEGYQVESVTDVFVEPQVKQKMELLAPVPFTPGPESLKHLANLVRMFWWRIQKRDFDTHAFETSAMLAAEDAANVYKSDAKGGKKGDHKPLAEKALQKLYEQWLIEDWQQRR
ncbi:MAG: PD-(D/E)XK nuclease family protein, partial [Coriobacteriales bacterium]|nr:PD-(D/E)XK nuclease family protein [Coriobacteriales bacterium]